MDSKKPDNLRRVLCLTPEREQSQGRFVDFFLECPNKGLNNHEMRWNKMVFSFFGKVLINTCRCFSLWIHFTIQSYLVNRYAMYLANSLCWSFGFESDIHIYIYILSRSDIEPLWLERNIQWKSSVTFLATGPRSLH